MADLKRLRFGRSSEAHEPTEQISFMEVDGKIVFFNESGAVAAEAAEEEEEEASVPAGNRKKSRGSGKRICPGCRWL